MSGTIIWKDEYADMIPSIVRVDKGNIQGYLLKFEDKDSAELLHSEIPWFDHPRWSTEYSDRTGSKTPYLFRTQSEVLEFYIRKVYEVTVRYPLNIPLGDKEHYYIAQAAYEALELREFDLRAQLS